MNYEKVYNQIIERARTRVYEGYTEKHHVIPKCMGGNNEKDNIVKLTAREHFICHQLLCEIYPNEIKLKFALRMMCIQSDTQNRYTTSSRTFSRIREEAIKLISISNTGKIRSAESKARYSAAQKGNKKFLGKTHSEETKKKMSERKKGIPRPAHVVEALRELANTRKGKSLSPEVKAKISAKLKGRKFSAEHRAKLSQSLMGHEHSEETKLKISKSKRK